MRILIIGSEKKSPESILGYSDMWMHFLCDALKKCGVELGWHRGWASTDSVTSYTESVLTAAGGYDAILAPGVRYFTTIPPEVGGFLRRKFPGVVAHIYDGSMLDCQQVDLTFTVRDDTWRYLDNPSRLARHQKYNFHIGWAANPHLFYPEPADDGVLRIFVDHTAFDVSGTDASLTVQMNLRYLNTPYIARTLTDEGIVTIDAGHISVKPYNRKPVPAPVLAAELRAADIFIVTHPESLGLTVLEAAMCGALIIAPEGAIAPDRLAEVNHMTFKSRIDWEGALVQINRHANAARVAHCTWENVVRRMLSVLMMRGNK